jgi:hypothetical protein
VHWTIPWLTEVKFIWQEPSSYWMIHVITNKITYHIYYDKRPETVTRTIITPHGYKPEYDLCHGWPMSHKKSQKFSRFQ